MKVMAVLGLLAILGAMTAELQKITTDKSAEYILVIEERADAENDSAKICLQTESGTVEMPLEEYLVGVVLTEMPASFSLEAMKAQAIAARTFTMRSGAGDKHGQADVCSSSDCCQAWRSDSQLRQIFGEDYDEYILKGKTAVEATEGMVLTYQGELIDAVYFSCSGGSSEDAVAVWGTDVPYLRAVSSPGEERASKFKSEVRVPFREFCDKIVQMNSNAQFSVIPQDWIGDTSYTPGGGVATMLLGGVPFSGTELRRIFGLGSTKFQLGIGDGEVVFSVQGYGHRVGMSQYGAEAMAVLGADYEKILTHYYTGVSIKKLSRNEFGTVKSRN